MAAEMKLLVASPSAKNWPLALGLGGVLTLTGAAGFGLQLLGLHAALVTACVGVALTVYPVLSAANTEYWVTNTRVVARSGLLVKSERSIALAEVRELRLKRSPVQRALGLGDVEVVGAAESVLLAGLEDAESARDRILSVGA